MSADPAGIFYGDLASWWPLISPVRDYAEEAAFARVLFASHTVPVRDILELGSGGGHNAYFLKDHFELTLSDLSDSMLDQSRALNPGCAHVAGDMRTLRLDRGFDAVFVHDAIEYMQCEADLRAALVTVFVHLKPGGLAVVMPDATTEIFQPSEAVGGSDGDGRSVRFMEWTFDPDPSDELVQTEYVFALRRGTERVEIIHETHRTGLFSRVTWMRLLGEVGFDARWIVEPTDEDRAGREVFIAVRPESRNGRTQMAPLELARDSALRGDRVLLRPATIDDVDRIVEIRSAPQVRDRWLGVDLRGEFFDDIMSTDVHLLAIEDEHGTVIGGIQWHEEADPMYRHAGIDLYIDPSRHGQGYGTEAVRVLTTDLIEVRGHHRLVIDPSADNVAAIACYRKVGFKPVGVMRRYERGQDGNWHDGLLMDLIADDIADGARSARPTVPNGPNGPNGSVG